MASEDSRSRPPEVLPLPPVTIPQLPIFEEPYGSRLEKQRQELQQALQARRKADRLERIKRIQAARNSKVVVYYSLDTLHGVHAEALFDILHSLKRRKRVDMFLLSAGGFADPAFRMAEICRNFREDNFGVLIPYYAKSAATLFCLGADELVMGPASEIGPTDPRIKYYDEFNRALNISATSVEDALKVIEEVAGTDPARAMKYMPLIQKINLNIIGEYRRALESSKQYAVDLLRSGMLKGDPGKAEATADRLAKHYKSHGYPIRATVAQKELHLKVTEADAALWDTMWQLHKLYDVFIRESRNEGQMIPTVFEAEEFTLGMPRMESD